MPPDRSEKPEPDLPFLLIARMIMFVYDLAPPLRGDSPHNKHIIFLMITCNRIKVATQVTHAIFAASVSARKLILYQE